MFTKKNFFISNIFSFLFVIISGCSGIPTPGGAFIESTKNVDDLATIHFYRPNTLYMSLIETNIFIDNIPRAVLSSGTYSTIHLKPGSYRFQSKQKPSKSGKYSAMLGSSTWMFLYEVKAGKTYYVAWYPSGVFSNKYKGKFIVSNAVTNSNAAWEGLLADVDAEFGIVDPVFGKEQIINTKQSNSIVEPNRI